MNSELFIVAVSSDSREDTQSFFRPHEPVVGKHTVREGNRHDQSDCERQHFANSL